MIPGLRKGRDFLSIYVVLMLTLFLYLTSLTYQPIDEFCFTNINLAELMMRGKEIKISELGVSGFYVSHMVDFYHRFHPHVMLVFISMITDIDPKHIVLLPLPMFLAVLSIWLVLRTLTNLSSIHRMIFVLMFSSTLSMNFFFEFYYISFAFSLLLLYTYIVLKFSLNDSVNAVTLYILLYTAMVFSHYAAALIAIIIMFMLKLKSKRLLLVATFLILFISIELVIYVQTAIQTALANAISITYSQIIHNVQEYLKNLFLTSVQSSSYTELNPYLVNSIIQIAGSLNRLLMFLYVTISLLIFLKSKTIIRFLKDKRTWAIISLFTAGISETLVYLFMNFGVLLRFTWIVLVLFMAYIWPLFPDAETRFRKSNAYKVLILIIAVSTVCMVIMNFTRSYVFSLEYGADYSNFYQKAHQSSLFFILNDGGGTVFTDHFTAAVMTNDALSLESKRDIRILIIVEESPELDKGYYVLPVVKAFRAGWFGHVSASKLHTILSMENIIYNSGFFRIYMLR